MTGLVVNKKVAQMGNISIQAIKPQKETVGIVNVSDGAVVGKNQVVGLDEGIITKNKNEAIEPINNIYKKPLATLSPIVFKNTSLVNKDNTLLINPIVNVYSPKLVGISEQRPEIISLSDFGSIYEGSTNELSEVGRFLELSIAARKIRFEHIQALISTVRQIDGANKLFEEIAENYANEIDEAKITISLMEQLFNSIKDIKKSLNIRQSDSLSDEKILKNVVPAKTYKEFIVEEYKFSESGFANFSNTKILGQFFFDIRNTLKQYSPSLIGGSFSPPVNSLNDNIGGLQMNQPTIDENFFNTTFTLGEAEEETISRNADREFGAYNKQQIDITDGQFDFQVRLFGNINFSLIGTPFNQFLDLLPGASEDRVAILLQTLSKELRISSGLGKESIKNIILDRFGGSDVGDPFQYIIGEPGDLITDPVVGGSSLCSLLRYENNDGEIVLPFESTYVRGEDGRLYIPGTKELADSILQSEEPYNIDKIRNFRHRVSSISSDAISAIKGLLNVGKRTPRLNAYDLLNELLEDFVESVETLGKNVPKEGNELLPSGWGEASLIKMALSDPEIKQLLFQYVLTLGMIGKPGNVLFGDNSVTEFFKGLASEEFSNWGDLPVVAQDKNLNTITSNSLVSVLEKLSDQFLGADTLILEAENLGTESIASNSTTNSITGYAVLAFIVQTLLNKAKQKGDQNGGGNGVVLNLNLSIHLISTKDLVFLNKIVDFISNITNRANDFFQDGKSRLTRLNYSTIAAFAFEVYCSFLDMYLDGVSEPTPGDNLFRISYDLDKLKGKAVQAHAVRRAFSGGRRANRQQTTNETLLLQTAPLAGTKQKLVKEEKLITQIIARMRKTFDVINNSTSNAVDFLNPVAPNIDRLNALLDVQGGLSRVAMIDEAQIMLSRQALNEFRKGKALSLLTGKTVKYSSNILSHRGVGGFLRRRRNLVGFPVTRRYTLHDLHTPVFVDESVVSPNEKKLIEIILQRDKFKGTRAENLKILTVGIPAGFSNHLESEINITEDNANNILDKEKDVIAINVYRRSIDFEHIVFKPKTYIFELSRFISRAEVNSQEIVANKFNEFINDESLQFMRDFSKKAAGDLQTIESLIQNDEYKFLSDDQKKEMVKNHIESFVLGLYMQLMVGVSTDENDYLVDRDLAEGFIEDEAKERFKDLLLLYIQGLTKQPLTLEILKDSSPQIKKLLDKIDNYRLHESFTEQIIPPEIPGNALPITQRVELVEDLLNFVKLFTPKSVLTGGKVQALRMTSPKLFERIFNIAVDPDDFEIDITKTFSTKSGKNMYTLLKQQGFIINDTKIKERRKNQTIAMDQYFVNISTVGATQ